VGFERIIARCRDRAKALSARFRGCLKIRPYIMRSSKYAGSSPGCGGQPGANQDGLAFAPAPSA
jgi:hypothetical protein